MSEPIDISTGAEDITEIIDKELIDGKGELSEDALKRIRNKINEVNNRITGAERFGFTDNGSLMYGKTEIKIRNSNGDMVSYKEAFSDWASKLESEVGSDDQKYSVDDAADKIAKDTGEGAGMEGEALKTFEQAKAAGIKETLRPELNEAGRKPVASEKSKVLAEKAGIKPDGSNAPRSPQSAAELQAAIKNPTGMQKIIIDLYSEQIPETVRKGFQDQATEIYNDNTKYPTEDAKNTALKKLVLDIKERAREIASASETWGEKLSRWGDYLLKAFDLLGGILKFALNLLPAILLIIFGYEYVDNWAKVHTGCLMDVIDSSQNVAKSYKVQGLTCTNTYKNKMGSFQDFPDYVKECSTITPTPAPPDSCQQCLQGITKDDENYGCPCPYNDSSNGVYASNWCDSKYLSSTDKNFAHKYYKRYYSWMDAFLEVSTLFFGFLTGFNPLPEGSFLGQLIKLLETFGIVAVVFVALYGIFYLLKEFGILKGGSGTTVVIEEEHHKDDYKEKEYKDQNLEIQPQQILPKQDESKKSSIDFSNLSIEQVPADQLNDYLEWQQKQMVDNPSYKPSPPNVKPSLPPIPPQALQQQVPQAEQKLQQAPPRQQAPQQAPPLSSQQQAPPQPSQQQVPQQVQQQQSEQSSKFNRPITTKPKYPYLVNRHVKSPGSTGSQITTTQALKQGLTGASLQQASSPGPSPSVSRRPSVASVASNDSDFKFSPRKSIRMSRKMIKL